MLLLVAIEATAMGLLLVSYLYLRGNFQVWPPTPAGRGALRLATVEAVLLGAELSADGGSACGPRAASS